MDTTETVVAEVNVALGAVPRAPRLKPPCESPWEAWALRHRVKGPGRRQRVSGDQVLSLDKLGPCTRWVGVRRAR